MGTVKKVPMRQCTGCGEMKNKKDMVRILRTTENEIVLDATGRKNGRGAYLCRSRECFQKAVKSRGLERSLKAQIPAEVYEALEKEMEAIAESDTDTTHYSKSSLDLDISSIYVHTNSAATYCEGKITNNGTETFYYIRLKGSFKDWWGNIIEIGDTYAVGAEGLSPGESTTFKIYCDKNSEIEDCIVTIISYD